MFVLKELSQFHSAIYHTKKVHVIHIEIDVFCSTRLLAQLIVYMRFFDYMIYLPILWTSRAGTCVVVLSYFPKPKVSFIILDSGFNTISVFGLEIQIVLVTLLRHICYHKWLKLITSKRKICLDSNITNTTTGNL